eukprot:GHVN01103785.1.p1 GENE.GHVN01103785.1~~GHVN01103785.1.p1  ORF type:complete len:395 (+),score=43.86 GHVN01103785.1:49-1233(+)
MEGNSGFLSWAFILMILLLDVIAAGRVTPVVIEDYNGAGESKRGRGDSIHSPSDHKWVVGLIIGMTGAFIGSLGTVLIRKAFVNDKCEGMSETPRGRFWMFSCPVWLCGMFCSTVVNPISNCLALTFAPATIISLLGGVHVLYNMGIAKWLLSEVFTKWDVIGTLLVVAGMSGVILFSGKHQAFISAQHFITSLKDPVPLTFIVVVTLLISLGVLMGLERVSRSIPVSRSSQRVALCIASGMLGACSTLCAKAMMLCVSDIVAHSRTDLLHTPIPYLVVIITVGVSIAQLYMINVTFSKFETVFVVPVMSAVSIATGVCGGVTLWKEIPSSLVFMLISIVLIGPGLACLSKGLSHFEKTTNQSLTSGSSLRRGSGADYFAVHGESDYSTRISTE